LWPKKLYFSSEILTVGVQLTTTDYFVFAEAIAGFTEISCEHVLVGPFNLRFFRFPRIHSLLSDLV